MIWSFHAIHFKEPIKAGTRCFSFLFLGSARVCTVLPDFGSERLEFSSPASSLFSIVHNIWFPTHSCLDYLQFRSPILNGDSMLYTPPSYPLHPVESCFRMIIFLCSSRLQLTRQLREYRFQPPFLPLDYRVSRSSSLQPTVSPGGSLTCAVWLFTMLCL